MSINYARGITTPHNYNISRFENVSSNFLAVDNKIIFDHTATITKRSQTIAINNLDQINLDQINLDQGNDSILGIAHGFGMVATANSAATIKIVDALGVVNQDRLNTGQGNNAIIGIAKASGLVNAQAHQTPAFSHQSSFALNRESVATVDALAIGIDNQSKILAGSGHDLILGIASTFAISQSQATTSIDSFAGNIVDNSEILDHILDDLEIMVPSIASTAIAETITNAQGIINHELILTGIGNDTVMGVANNHSFSKALTVAEAEFVTEDAAAVRVDSSSLAISKGKIVGIVNQGEINTGKGEDTIIGISLNTANATANADADAVTLAQNTNSQAHTNSLADTSAAISIGIDNNLGQIDTGEGNDSIIGYGAVGIQGGEIDTGKGNDRIISDGDLVGIEDSKINLGEGDDYFKATLVNFDSLMPDNLSNQKVSAITNTIVAGGLGDDIFEIVSFSAEVSIDAGLGNDVLKLSDNIENYLITKGSSEQKVIVRDADATLFVTNVETFYFGDRDFAYSFSELIW